MSTTLDSEEERVIEAGKEEWRQRTGSSVLDMRILSSPNERHEWRRSGRRKERREEWRMGVERAESR